MHRLRPARARPQAARGPPDGLLRAPAPDRPRRHHREAEHRALRAATGSASSTAARRRSTSSSTAPATRSPSPSSTPRCSRPPTTSVAALPQGRLRRAPGPLLHRPDPAAGGDHADRRGAVAVGRRPARGPSPACPRPSGCARRSSAPNRGWPVATSPRSGTRSRSTSTPTCASSGASAAAAPAVAVPDFGPVSARSARAPAGPRRGRGRSRRAPAPAGSAPACGRRAGRAVAPWRRRLRGDRAGALWAAAAAGASGESRRRSPRRRRHRVPAGAAHQTSQIDPSTGILRTTSRKKIGQKPVHRLQSNLPPDCARATRAPAPGPRRRAPRYGPPPVRASPRSGPAASARGAAAPTRNSSRRECRRSRPAPGLDAASASGPSFQWALPN